MVASFILLLLSLISCLVHADLWLVIKKQAHIFAPLFQLIPVKQRKTYQGAYRNSLKRRFYCVQDKVDVSGTTFTACFTLIYGYLFLANLLSSERYITTFQFWLQGMSYYVFLLYCLGSYRDQRELCFYCKFEMAQGGLHCLLGFFFMTEQFCWGFVIAIVFILVCVILIRQAHKEDRDDERVSELEREQYEAKMKAAKVADKEDDGSYDTADGAAEDNQSSEDHGSEGSAYLTPQKAAGRAPPKASARQRTTTELLPPIPEDETNEEDIEVIECPGVEGRERDQQRMQQHMFNPMDKRQWQRQRAPQFKRHNN